MMHLAEALWDYHHLNHGIVKSDCILVLGSHDTRVAVRGAELYMEGFAPVLIFSGGLGNLTKGVWKEAEADKFAAIAVSMGVPESDIIIENRSANTGGNIQFTKRLLKEKKLDFSSFIVVQKPYMERRSFATFKKNWPEKDLVVTSPQISFADYPNDEISMDDVINIMAGDLQRIRLYPEKGYQIYQDIPDRILQVYERLVELGYTGHLLSELNNTKMV